MLLKSCFEPESLLSNTFTLGLDNNVWMCPVGIQLSFIYFGLTELYLTVLTPKFDYHCSWHEKAFHTYTLVLRQAYAKRLPCQPMHDNTCRWASWPHGIYAWITRGVQPMFEPRTLQIATVSQENPCVTHHALVEHPVPTPRHLFYDSDDGKMGKPHSRINNA